MTKYYKTTKGMEGILCQLSQDDLIEVKDICKEGAKRKSKTSTKEFFVHDYSVGWTRS